MRYLRTTTLTAGIFLLLGTSAYAQSHLESSSQNKMPMAVTPDSIHWMDAPNTLPAGAQYTILDSNPKDKNNLTVRIKYPANYQIAPVYTTSPLRVTVISGSLNLGVGDTVDTNSMKNLPAGSFIVMPAQKHHYVSTTEETIIQVNGPSLSNLKYVNPKDDPRKKVTAPSSSTTTTPSTSTSVPTPTAPQGNGTMGTPSVVTPQTPTTND